MNRRDLLLGSAMLAGGLASRQALANVPTPYDWSAAPPMDSREAFVAWMQKNRGEDAGFLGQRFDRFLELINHQDVWDAADKRAFLMTPREEFVTAENLGRAYEWHHLNIGFGVTITGPHTVARMTNTLNIKRGDKVLEIGTGSGYQSAYLANLTDRLWSIEIIPALARRTRALYDRLIADGYSEYRSINYAQRRRLLRLGGGGAFRQDHRHLRHRPYPAAAAAADEPERDHGHSRRSARRPACHQSGQAKSGGWDVQRDAVRHLRRRDHPLRALHRRPPDVTARGLHSTNCVCVTSATSLPSCVVMRVCQIMVRRPR